MASMLSLLDGFSQALVSFGFDSWCMYIFCWALISLFHVFLVTFHFLLAFYSAFCSSLILT